MPVFHLIRSLYGTFSFICTKSILGVYIVIIELCFVVVSLIFYNLMFIFVHHHHLVYFEQPCSKSRMLEQSERVIVYIYRTTFKVPIIVLQLTNNMRWLKNKSVM